MYGREFYDNVADALAGFLPPSMRGFEMYRSSRNLKLWYANDRVHYEVQIVKRGKVVGLEIGFHTEYKDKTKNDEVVASLQKEEKSWRTQLGAEPEIAAFIGLESGPWKRISEVWETDVDDSISTAVDAAERLSLYVKTFEPLLEKKT